MMQYTDSEVRIISVIAHHIFCQTLLMEGGGELHSV